MTNNPVKNHFNSFLAKAKRIHSRLPESRIILGLLLGGLTGLLGGWAGFIIGLVLGYLVQELLGQFRNDREVHDYFENPGASHFYEGEPGLAAFCALGILIAAKSSSGPECEEAAVRETGRKAGLCFPAAASNAAMIEQFCRLAWQNQKKLNPDLLTESLLYRRKNFQAHDCVDGSTASSPGDLSNLGAELYDLSSSGSARSFADEIRHKLDPGYRPVPKKDDPWKILGVSPQTPPLELKSHYHRLAAQFHPDVLQGLDDEHQETAARAFIAIREAYNEIAGKNAE